MTIAVMYLTCSCEKKSWKKLQAWMVFKPMTFVIPVHCSTNWGCWAFQNICHNACGDYGRIWIIGVNFTYKHKPCNEECYLCLWRLLTFFYLLEMWMELSKKGAIIGHGDMFTVVGLEQETWGYGNEASKQIVSKIFFRLCDQWLLDLVFELFIEFACKSKSPPCAQL